jgi:exodeoxyribonuclease-3
MRFVSFNANSIRARLHQLEAIEASHAPDIVAIQETKVSDEEFPYDDIRGIGYPHVEVYGQKGHYGVALLSKLPPRDVQLGIPWDSADQQRRFISAVYDCAGTPTRIINGYFPQGESREHPNKFPGKAKFFADVNRFLQESCNPDEALILAGDLNVAPDDEDIGIGEDNQKRWLRDGKTSFLPEEREWLKKLTDWGLIDSYAQTSSDEARLHSWFDYRSRGFERDPKRGLRIDLILVSRGLRDKIAGCGIDQVIRAQEKPSDHCPIWCDFSL